MDWQYCGPGACHIADNSFEERARAAERCRIFGDVMRRKNKPSTCFYAPIYHPFDQVRLVTALFKKEGFKVV
jgi:hypothetical protein